MDHFQYLKLLDVFPKTVDDAKEPSVSGGGVSIVVFVVLAILFVSEVKRGRFSTSIQVWVTQLFWQTSMFLEVKTKHELHVDTTRVTQLPIV